MTAVTAYVSGGSNLDTDAKLRLAARELKRLFPGARFSRCYRNKAVGFDGPDFINFVAELPVSQGVAALKAALEEALSAHLLSRKDGVGPAERERLVQLIEQTKKEGR